MSFLSPFMLWGAAAAAIPIAIHFFFRSRYRTVPWAAMKFLLTSIEQTSRRLRFQELLLLLLRVAVLALLALALARPLSSAFSGGSGAGEAVDVVFLFDTSLSMGAADGTGPRLGDDAAEAARQFVAVRTGAKRVTRLDQAKAAALQILDRLPPYSTVQIVTCADRAELLGPRSPGNLDRARYLIDGLGVTSLGTDYLPGLKQSLDVLRRSQLPGKELYVFSDMQKSGWEAQPGPVAEALRDIDRLATVFLVRCGQRAVKNVALTGISPQTGIPRPGQRVGFTVLVANTGAEPLKDVEVALTVDGVAEDGETKSVRELGPGSTTAVTLTAAMKKPGLHTVTARLKGDDLPGDNRFDQVILVREDVRVLVVDGRPNREEPTRSAAYYLDGVFGASNDAEKSGRYLAVTLITPGQASEAFLQDQDVCVLADVAVEGPVGQALKAEFLDALDRYVRDGHGLMVFAGANVKTEAYNKTFVEKYKLLPLPVAGLAEYPKDEPVYLNRNSVRLPAFRKVSEDEYYKLLDIAQAWKVLRLEEKDQGRADKGDGRAQAAFTVGLRYSNGLPAVVTARADRGEVMLFTTSADPGLGAGSIEPSWTNWPINPTFPPLIMLSLNHLLHGQTQSHNAAAGTAINWFAPRPDSDKSFVLFTPDGQRRRLGLPTMVQDRPLVTLEGLPVAGVYRLDAQGAGRDDVEYLNDPLLVEQLKNGTSQLGTPFAVTPDAAETANLESKGDEEIDQSLGFRPVHMSAAEDLTAFSEFDRTNREWTGWVLLAVLLLATGEMWLAWFCGRPIT